MNTLTDRQVGQYLQDSLTQGYANVKRRLDKARDERNARLAVRPDFRLRIAEGVQSIKPDLAKVARALNKQRQVSDFVVKPGQQLFAYVQGKWMPIDWQAIVKRSAARRAS